MKSIADIEKTYSSHDYNLCAFKVLEPKHWTNYGVVR